jgi:putative phosphoesterase
MLTNSRIARQATEHSGVTSYRLAGDCMASSSLLVGLISDTHGLMRPEALDSLRKSDLIIHAGDIGNPAVLETLQRLAPVHAIRGNNDQGAWTRGLPDRDTLKAGVHTIYVLHNLAELALDPAASGFSVVISGHSHKPALKTLNNVLYVNPGSAGPRRFTLPVTVGTLDLLSDRCEANIIQLI